MRNKFTKGSLASLMGSVIVLVCRLEIILRTAAIELRNLDVMETTGSQDGKGQVMVLDHQRKKKNRSMLMDSRVKTVIRKV